MFENILGVHERFSTTILTTISCVQANPSLPPGSAQQIHRAVAVEIKALPHYARSQGRPVGTRLDRNQVFS